MLSAAAARDTGAHAIVSALAATASVEEGEEWLYLPRS